MADRKRLTTAEVLADDRDIMVDELSADGAPFSLIAPQVTMAEERIHAREAVQRIARGDAQNWTVHGIAYSALAVADSDILKACEQLRLYGATHEGVDEAILCITEAQRGLETAMSLVQGKAWML